MSAENPAPISETASGTIAATFDVYPSQLNEMASTHVGIATAVIKRDGNGTLYAVLGGLRSVPETGHLILVASMNDLINDFDDDDAN